MNITIVGCGWLGQQIGVSFLKEGHTVRGSFRSSQTKKKIELLGLVAFSLEEPIWFQTDFLIICLPPSSATSETSYSQLLSVVLRKFNDKTKIIFTSSTGVYPKTEGFYDENYEFFSPNQKSPLYQAEQVLQKEAANRLAIFRLGGLIGPNRHPIKFISGKRYNDDGSSPLALIDSRDICRLMLFTVKNEWIGEIFNVVYPTEITKKEYYLHMAKKMKMKSPLYGLESGIIRKISSEKLDSLNGFELKFNIENYESELLFV